MHDVIEQNKSYVRMNGPRFILCVARRVQFSSLSILYFGFFLYGNGFQLQLASSLSLSLACALSCWYWSLWIFILFHLFSFHCHGSFGSSHLAFRSNFSMLALFGRLLYNHALPFLSFFLSIVRPFLFYLTACLRVCMLFLLRARKYCCDCWSVCLLCNPIIYLQISNLLWANR